MRQHTDGRIAGWEQYTYPVETGSEVNSRLMEDIRKRLWIMFFGWQTTPDRVAEPKGTYGDGPDDPDPQSGNWMGGWFRGSNTGLYNESENPGDLDNIKHDNGPGKYSVWHDDVLPNASIVGLSYNYKGGGKSHVWIATGSVPDTNDEETYEGDYVPGVPIELVGSGVPIEAKNFWRIKSVDSATEPGYLLLELYDFHKTAGSDLELDTDYGEPIGGGYSSGGSIKCDFGGEWWTLCPYLKGEGSSGRFVTDRDLQHKYENNYRGDDEKRPPDGGKFAEDYNGWWRRTVNPYRYHHFDPNSHRWICNGQRKDTDYYFSIIKSVDWLPICTDPFEQVEPTIYDDTGRHHFKAAGNKVEIDSIQIYDRYRVGPRQRVSVHLKMDIQYGTVQVNAINYQTREWDDGEDNYYYGSQPEFTPDGVLYNQQIREIEYHWPSKCPWAWIDFAGRKRQFLKQVDTGFKINWLELHRNHVDYYNYVDSGYTSTATYGDLWFSGTWNTAGYRPHLNLSQSEWAFLYDEAWGENGSALELILRDIGQFDWHFDTNEIYVPSNILNAWGDIRYDKAGNHNGDGGTAAFADLDFPWPIGTWRRVPRWSMGYVDGPAANDPGVTGFMRSVEKGTPSNSNWDQKSQWEPAQGHFPWIGRYVHADDNPGPSEFGNYGTYLLERHGPHHVTGTTYFHERSMYSLRLMMDVLDQMIYTDMSTSVSMTWVGKSTQAEPAWQDMTSMTLGSVYASVQAWTKSFMSGQDCRTWTSVTPMLVGNFGFQRYRPTMEDPWEEWTVYLHSGFAKIGEHQVALKLTGVNIPSGITRGIIRIKIDNSKYTATYPDGPVHLASVITPGGSVQQSQPTGPDKYVYMHAAVQQGDSVYFRMYLGNPFGGLYTTEVTGLNEVSDKRTEAELSVAGSTGFSDLIAEVDWDLWDDATWVRDITYANLLAFDPEEDTRPPIYGPPEFFQKPVIYDANRPEYDDTGRCYADVDYLPEWHIKMELKFMQDLEGNGVSWRTIPQRSGDSTFYSGWINTDLPDKDRKWDFIIDMGIGANPGDAADLLAAFDDDETLKVWSYKLDAKDNASDAGEGQTDNACDKWSVEERVEVEEYPILPPNAAAAEVTYQGDGPTDPPEDEVLVSFTIRASIGMGLIDDRDVEYQFYGRTAVNQVHYISDWQDDPSITITPADEDDLAMLPTIIEIRMRTKINQVDAGVGYAGIVDPFDV